MKRLKLPIVVDHRFTFLPRQLFYNTKSDTVRDEERSKSSLSAKHAGSKNNAKYS